MAEIDVLKQNMKQTKKNKNKKGMNDIIVASLEILVKVQGDISKNALTKNYIASILFVKYNMYVDSKLKRDVLASMLREKK